MRQGEALAVGRMEGGLRDRVNQQLARFEAGQAVAPAGGHGQVAVVNEDHMRQQRTALVPGYPLVVPDCNNC